MVTVTSQVKTHLTSAISRANLLTVGHSLGFIEGGEFLGIVSVKVIDDTKRESILKV